jgi:hypothetical protein
LFLFFAKKGTTDMANIFDEQDEQDEAQPATFELGSGYSSLSQFTFCGFIFLYRH